MVGLLSPLFYSVAIFRLMIPACNLGFDPFTDRDFSLEPVVLCLLGCISI